MLDIGTASCTWSQRGVVLHIEPALQPIQLNVLLFHYSHIMNTQNQNDTQVKEERIKNATIMKQFGNIQEVSFISNAAPGLTFEK